MADADAVISGRNFLVYSVAHDVENELPALTVDYGTAWGTVGTMPNPWEDRGYTIGGLSFNAALERGEIRVDQEFDPVVQPVTARNITLGTSFAEITAENMQLASGMGTISNTAPGAGTRGENTLTIGSSITDQYNSWGFDIKQPNGEAFRIIVYKGIATGSPNLQFQAEDAAVIELEVSALVDTSTDPSRIAKVQDVLPAQ